MALGHTVETIDDFDHEARQVIIGQPLVDRWRQQVSGATVSKNEAAHRKTAEWTAIIVPQHVSREKTGKSAKLLDTATKELG